jgi:hypothetical protein
LPRIFSEILSLKLKKNERERRELICIRLKVCADCKIPHISVIISRNNSRETCIIYQGG